MMSSNDKPGWFRRQLRLLRTKVLLVILSVCALLWALWWDSPPRYNEKFTEEAVPASMGDAPLAFGIWPEIATQDDKTMMMTAFSGGGSRAAAVAWKALETLKSIPYVFNDVEGKLAESNLAHEIDLTAGISGGSFAAAAWCMGNEDLEPFRKRFVERNIQGALARNLFSGGGVRAAFSQRYSRIDLAAELYDHEVFDGMTFGMLPSRPILLIHATNLALGQRFTFSPEDFNLIGSSLKAYPLGYACAASSAFPILLNPMTLKNYGPTEAAWTAISDRYKETQKNQRKDIEKYFKRVRWDHYHEAAANRYIHLADGGLADNQGLQSLLDQFADGILSKRLNQPPALERLILLNVNAGVASESGMIASPSAPGVGAVVEGAMVTSMDILSAKRWAEIRETSNELYSKLSDARSRPSDDRGGQTSAETLLSLEKPYLIEVNFRNIRDQELRRRAWALPTSFKLDSEQLALIDKVVPALLYEDPGLQKLMMEQLVGVILRAQPLEHRGQLEKKFMETGPSLSVVGVPEMAALRKDPNLHRIALGLLRVLLQGSPTLNGLDRDQVEKFAERLKGP